MLFMGCGNHSAAQVLDRVERLLKLYNQLSGVQQSGTGPEPVSFEEHRALWDELKGDAEMLIRHIAEDFDLKARMER